MEIDLKQIDSLNRPNGVALSPDEKQHFISRSPDAAKARV